MVQRRDRRHFAGKHRYIYNSADNYNYNLLRAVGVGRLRKPPDGCAGISYGCTAGPRGHGSYHMFGQYGDNSGHNIRGQLSMVRCSNRRNLTGINPGIYHASVNGNYHLLRAKYIYQRLCEFADTCNCYGKPQSHPAHGLGHYNMRRYYRKFNSKRIRRHD